MATAAMALQAVVRLDLLTVDAALAPLAGRPLYAWATEAACQSRVFTAVTVADADGRLVRDAAQRFGQKVTCDGHPEAAAGPTCIIQARFPLLEATDLIHAAAAFRESTDQHLVGVRPWTRPLWEAGRYQSGSVDRAVLCEAFRFCRSGATLEVTEGTTSSVCSVRPALDVDASDADFAAVAARRLQRRFIADERWRRIKMIVVDVDGTLTDGGMYYSADGELAKKFQTRDAQGLKQCAAAGLEVATITAEDSPAVRARMAKLGLLDTYYAGIKDKLPVLQRHVAARGLTLADVAYVGDDAGDRECLAQVGLAVCPADAMPIVQPLAHYVTHREAGAGAVREVCDLLLEARRGAPGGS